VLPSDARSRRMPVFRSRFMKNISASAVGVTSLVPAAPRSTVSSARR
jgi:hypothetical protein